MNKKSIYIISVIGCLFIVCPSFAQPTAQQVMELEMAKARAEKARNDAIVEKQRAAEKAQKASPSPSPASGATKGKASQEKAKPEKAASEKSRLEKAMPEKSIPEKSK